MQQKCAAIVTWLLVASVEGNGVRAWLELVSPVIANHYAELKLYMKTKTLGQWESSTQSSFVSLRKLHWRDDAELLEWLDLQ